MPRNCGGYILAHYIESTGLMNQWGNSVQKDLFRSDYKHQLSGHETFPMRYGWLKKAYDAVAEEEHLASAKIFTSDDAIARFGIGKNMVSSLRHWATVAGVLENIEGGKVTTTELGKMLFDDNGYDPFMESPTTLWLIHWMFAGRTEKTTWHWAFSYFNPSQFDRDQLATNLLQFAKERNWTRTSPTTIKRDVECFVRSYVALSRSASASHEEKLESPLIELGLIRATNKNSFFQAVRGSKTTLTQGVFLFALIEFWLNRSSASTLSYEAIAHEPGSPGCVFLLDDYDLSDRLSDLDSFTLGDFKWSETAGLKQLVRNVQITPELALEYLSSDYQVASLSKKVA